MSALGSLVVSLSLEYANYTKGLERGSQESLRFAQGVQKSFDQAASASRECFTGMVKGAAAAAAAYLTVSAVIDSLKGAIDAADHLNDLSKKTGIAVETLGGLGFAATQAGLDLDGVATAAGKLNKSISEAATGNKEQKEAFDALGISIRDASGQLKKADVVMAEVADKFQQYQDGPEKSAIALRLFGKAGADIIPLLNDGGSALKEQVEYYKRFSGVTAETAAAADAYNDTLGKLNLISGAFSRTLAAVLLPAMQAIADKMLESKEKGDGFAYTAERLASAMTTIAKAAVMAGTGVLQLGEWLAASAASWKEILSGSSTGAEAVAKAYEENAKRIRTARADLMSALSNQPGASGGFYNAFDAEAAASTNANASAKKPRAPGLPDKSSGDATKKEFEGQLKSLEQSLAQQREVQQFNDRYVAELRAQDLISVQEYQEYRQRSLQSGLENATRIYDLEIAAAQEYRDKVAKLDEKQDATNKIAEFSGKKRTAEAQASQGQDVILLSQSRAQADLNKQVKDWIIAQDIAAQNALIEIDLMGRSAQEIEKLTAARRIQLDVEARVREAQKGSKDPIDRSQFDMEGDAAIARNNALIDARYAKERDPWFNMTESVRKYGEEASNTGKQIGDALTGAFRGAEDAFVQFVMTGKLSFGDMARSIIADMARIQAQKMIMALTGSAKDGGGDFMSLIKLGIGLFTGGGGVDLGVGTADGLFGFAKGGNPPVGKMSLVGEEGPELFIPSVPGTIIPAPMTKQLLEGSDGQGIFYPQSFGSIAPNKSLPAAMSQPAQKSGPVIHHNLVVNVDSRADRTEVQREIRAAVAEGNARLVDDLSRAGALA